MSLNHFRQHCTEPCAYIYIYTDVSLSLSCTVSTCFSLYDCARARVCVCVWRVKSLVWCVWVLRKSFLWIPLTHWGRVTHICVSKQTSIGSDNGLSPGRRQAIIWTNAGILLIGPMWTNFSEILIAIHIFFFKKMCLNMSSGNLRPFCLGLNMLTRWLCFWWLLWGVYCLFMNQSLL